MLTEREGERPPKSRWGSRVALRVLEWGALFGALAFLLGFVCSAEGERHPELGRQIEFPLSDPGDVVADGEGNLYVALDFYGRIQVYDAQGEFRYGYFVNSGGGQVGLTIDDADELTVLPIRTDHVHRFDQNGESISSKRKAQTEFEELWKNRDSPFVDENGVRYRIADRYWNPRIIAEDEAGQKRVLVQTPLALRPFVGPLPCWALALACGMLHFGLTRWSKHRETADVAFIDVPNSS